MARRRRAATAALAASLLLLAGCIDDGPGSGDGPAPEPQASATSSPRIRLGDVAVGSGALAERSGLYLCGEHVVASAPAGGIESDSFAVFDLGTRRGRITKVGVPGPRRPNARWLLTTECVDSGGRPFISVAYQEMPLLPSGGEGIRAAYTLGGRRMWVRDDLNMPGTVVDDVLVLGAAPEQPETAVDLRTGRTIATFDPSVQARTVVSGNRMVVRDLTGPPALMTLTGRHIATLRQASTFTADGGLLFGQTPAALPDSSGPGQPDSGGLTDASPSPSPTQTTLPSPRSGLFRGAVRAYSLRTGEPQWRLNVAPDPLGTPTAAPSSGLTVVVDVDGMAHGIDAGTGRQQWRQPTELVSPRVTTGAGIVLFDTIDDPFQKLLDARTGLPLPAPEEPIVDLTSAGALMIVDGVPRVVPPARLRTPPTTPEETSQP